MTEMEMKKSKVVVVVGSTATGKSKLAIDVARNIGKCEIISADSMQVYEGFDIGSAKVTREEMCGIPHHLLSIAAPDHPIDVRTFVMNAKQVISDITARGCLPIIVGGTFYWLEALLFDNFTSRSISTSDDAKSSSPFECLQDVDLSSLSSSEAYSLLVRVDPERAERLHEHDHRRTLRSLQVAQTSHVKHSEAIRESGGRLGRSSKPLYDMVTLWIDCNPDVLQDRIRRRIDEMLKDGVLNEVESLLEGFQKSGFEWTNKGLAQGIGFKELVPAVMCDRNDASYQDTLNECIETLKRSTIRYSNRQRKCIITHFVGIQQSPTLIRLDSTHVSEFTKNVVLPSSEICSKFILNEPINVCSFAHLCGNLDPLPDKCSSPASSKWQKFECKDCNRILNGRLEWEAHLKCRTHRRRKKKTLRTFMKPDVDLEELAEKS